MVSKNSLRGSSKKSLKPQQHKYKIVVFPDDKHLKKSVDIAPSNWVFYSKEFESQACHFPLGPFSDSQIEKLHRRVQKCEPPDATWPIHRVNIHGRARTYAEACDAIKKLEYNLYAFSTDRESSIERILHEENRKTLEEELDDASCVLPIDSTRIIKGKDLENPQDAEETISSKGKPLTSSSDSESSLRDVPRQNKIKKKKSLRSSSSRSSSVDSSPGKSMQRDVDRKNEPPKNRFATQESRNPPSAPSLASPRLFSEDEMLLQELKNKNEELKKAFNQIRTPSKTKQYAEFLSSFSPGSRSSDKLSRGELKTKDHKSSTNSSAPQKPAVVPSTSAQSGSSHKEPANSPVFQTLLTRKRVIAELLSSPSEDEEEKTPKHKKYNKRSRSRERKRLQEGHETHQLFSSTPLQESLLTSHRRLSGGRHSLNRSQSAENLKTPKKHAPKRARSSEDHYISRKTEIVVDNSLREFLKTMHHSLANKIDRLHGAQVETRGKLENLTRIVNKNASAQEDVDGDDDNDVNDPNPIVFPIATKEQFYIFDAKLKDDKEYRRKIKKRIRDMVPMPDKLYATHDLSVIIRMFLTQDLVKTSFVALKKSDVKDALKDTNFYKYLQDVHRLVRGDRMDEKTFQHHMKGMVNSASDWDGKRNLRRHQN